MKEVSLKSIAIVGNAAPLSDVSAGIDACDIVIRINGAFHMPSGLVGTRTDYVWAESNHLFFRQIQNGIINWKSMCKAVVLCTPYWRKRNSELIEKFFYPEQIANIILVDKTSLWIAPFQKPERALGDHLTSWTAMIYYCLQKPEWASYRIKLFCEDIQDRAIYRSEAATWHFYLSEEEATLQELIRLKRIEIGGEIDTRPLPQLQTARG